MATGEAVMFTEIWEDLEPEDRKSFITGHRFPEPYVMRTYYFAHVLGKGAYPEFRLKKENIVLLTWEQHKMWDTARFKIRENKHLMQLWKKMFDLEEKLIEEYKNIKIDDQRISISNREKSNSRNDF